MCLEMIPDHKQELEESLLGVVGPGGATWCPSFLFPSLQPWDPSFPEGPLPQAFPPAPTPLVGLRSELKLVLRTRDLVQLCPYPKPPFPRACLWLSVPRR